MAVTFQPKTNQGVNQYLLGAYPRRRLSRGQIQAASMIEKTAVPQYRPALHIL
jgi:hypothetical protein